MEVGAVLNFTENNKRFRNDNGFGAITSKWEVVSTKPRKAHLN